MPRSKVYTENGWIYEDDVIQDGYKSFYQSSEPTNAKVGDIWVNPDDMGSDYIYHEYSTSEKIVGKWIDGSTIYEKTYIVNNPSIGGERTIDTISDIGSLVKADAIVCDNTYDLSYYSDSLAYVGVKNTDLVYLLYSEASTINKLVVTFYYTKSTNGGN